MTILRTSFKPHVTADGRFSGYASVFGNRDSHDDLIERGAFERSLEEWRVKGRAPHMLLQHGHAINTDTPIGQWTLIREDARGLYVEGQLLALDTDLGRQLLSLLRGGVLTGLSIGFRPRRWRKSTEIGGPKRILTEIFIFEISLVTEPSNPETFIQPLAAQDAAYDKLQAALAAVQAEAAKASGKSAANPNDPADRFRAALRKLRN